MKFGLVGHPVAHSLSPVIHRAAYRELGVSHSYELFDAASEAEVGRVVSRIRGGELAGVNVTVPWKHAAFAAADRRSPLAERLGVVNVLAPAAGELVGHNTDALALEAEFRRLVSGQRAIVLGSGGAAPAVVAACRAAGIAEVLVTARRYVAATPSELWPGASALRGLGAELYEWPAASPGARERLDAALSGAALVVQCTSAGMHGADAGEGLAKLFDWQRLPPGAVAYDLIYAPLETPFLAAAAAAGLRTAHGLHMLVAQAAAAVEIWLGVRPPEPPLLRAALEALSARGRQ